MHGIVALPRVGVERTEVGQNAVAQEGSDMSAVLMDGVAHALVIAIQHTYQKRRV
jgi:azurin